MSKILLHVGYAKAGSTFLQEWFLAHPSIYHQAYRFAKGFIEPWELAHFAQKADKMPEVYALSCENLTVWQGEIELSGIRPTTVYDGAKFTDNMSRILNDMYPNAKILIITRGYKTVFKSIYSQYIRIGGTLSFKEAIQMLPYEQILDYSTVIETYSKKFGRENILYLPYELLLEDTNLFLQEIECFLELKNNYTQFSKVINKSLDKNTQATYLKVSKLIYSLVKIFSKQYQEKIYRLYIGLLSMEKTSLLFKRISRNPIEIPPEDELFFLKVMKGKANKFKNDKLYQPYLEDYLID